MKRLLKCGFFIGAILYCLITTVNGQDKLRVIHENVSESSPVAVVDRHIGDRRVDRKVENRHHLSAGQDWIKQLAFDVKNVSKKNITYINIQLVIPQTGAMERGMVLSLSFGQLTPTTPAKPGIVLPGDVVTIRLDDPERTLFEKYVQKYDADNIQRVTMDVREVHFDDGTGWIGGREFRVVSDNPSSRDVNHNGVSEAAELFTLPQVGLTKMELDYKEKKKTDEYGNKFKFRAKVKDAQGAQLGRWAWDVFLVRAP